MDSKPCASPGGTVYIVFLFVMTEMASTISEVSSLSSSAFDLVDTTDSRYIIHLRCAVVNDT